MMSRHPAVDVPGDDDDVVGPLGPALDRDHVADRVGVGMREPVNVSHGRTVGRPHAFELALAPSSSAAPMPRFGSVCDDSVCRVPKLDQRLDRVPQLRLADRRDDRAELRIDGDGGGAAPSSADAHQDRDFTHSTLP